MRWSIDFAIIGLAAGVVGMATPQYWPDAPQWLWGLLVGGGLVTMIIASIWGAWPFLVSLFGWHSTGKAASRKQFLQSSFEVLSAAQKSILHQISVQGHGRNISDNIWNTFEVIGFVERDFVGKKGLIPVHEKEIEKLLAKEDLLDLIPLHEAAQTAYDDTKSTLVVRLSERLNKDPMTMLGVLAQFLVHDEQIVIYGVYPPSQKLEEIPKQDAATFRFSDDAREMFDNYNEERRYVDLYVKREDFEKALAEI